MPSVIVPKVINDVTFDKKVIFADFETFQRPIDNTHKVYAVGYCCVEDLKGYKDKKINTKCVQILYGEDSLDKFMHFLRSLKGIVTICFYNGARFDYWFIIQWLINNHDISTPLDFTFKREEKTSGIPIFIMEKKKQYKLIFFDLFKFSMTGLDKACKSFGVPSEYSKGSFDHSKITGFISAEMHKKEVIEYLKMDVISMGILYRILSFEFIKGYSVNIKDFVSLSHMAYASYLNTLDKNIVHKLKLINDKQTYEWARGGLRGGRCSPFIPYYLTEFYNLFNEGWDELPYETKRILFDEHLNDKDEIYYIDYTSLYPAACEYKMPIGNWTFTNIKNDPHGICSEFLLLFKKFQRGEVLTKAQILKIKRSEFEIDYTCPKDIYLPFLIHRDEKNHMKADLKDRSNQRFDGKTLLHAIKHLKYKIKFIHGVMIFSDYQPIMKDFIQIIMQKKDEADQLKNMVARDCHKLVANGLSGKMNQIPIETDQHLYFTDDILYNYDLDKVKNIETFTKEGQFRAILVDFYRNDKNIYDKPIQIGMRILAIAKIIMSHFFLQAGCYGHFRRYKNNHKWTEDHLNDFHPLYYMDTDSAILPRWVVEKCPDQTVFGDGFKKFKREFPNFKMIAYVGGAPKTYFIKMIHRETLEMHMFYRSKGCPAAKYLCDKDKTWNLTKLEQTPPPLPKDNELSKPTFQLLDEDINIIQESAYLKWDWVEKIYIKKEKFQIRTVFGRLNKIFNDSNAVESSALNITYSNAHRKIGKKNWWAEGNRFYCETMGRAFPFGHECVPENWKDLKDYQLEEKIIFNYINIK